MNAIKAENLTYVYSPNTPFEKAAIQDINLEIEQGEFVGVIGHTGSGKSTLIQHFNGLLKPTSGRIFINGTDLWADGTDRRAYRFKVGLVFQYPDTSSSRRRSIRTSRLARQIWAFPPPRLNSG